MVSDSSASSDDYTNAITTGDDKPAFRTTSHEAKSASATEDRNKEEVTDDATDDEPQTEYLHGFKLFAVMAGMVIVMLLAMLDISILSTVCLLASYSRTHQLMRIPAGYPANH